MQTAKISTDTVKQLNSFLRGELSAAETYQLALQKLDRSAHRAVLEQCARSHQDRARLLAEEVARRGGEPSRSSGLWGTFARLVESGASALGDKAAIAALEEGEDHGRNDYRRDMKDLDPAAREFVQTSVLPEQNRTHQAMSTLKKSLS